MCWDMLLVVLCEVEDVFVVVVKFDVFMEIVCKKYFFVDIRFGEVVDKRVV